MKKVIYVSLMYCVFLKDRNLYCYCFEGVDSWCRFNRDIVNGIKLFKLGFGLFVEIIVEFKLIYLRFSEDVLLIRCLDGKI